jgi:hypothetical protein
VKADSKKVDLTILAGVGATFIALLIGWLVWRDNSSGFRDAGNFANLLAAVFSSIATIWLIVTVFRQGEELRLQREELQLQREETARLADEAKNQATSLTGTLRIQNQTSLTSTLQQIMDVNEGLMHNIFRRLLEIAFQTAAPEKAHYLVKGSGGSVTFSSEGAVCEVLQDGNASSVWITIAWTDLLEKFRLSEQPMYWQDYWHSLCSLASDANAANLGVFWRDTLSHSIAPKSIERTNEVRTVLLAALFESEPSLIPVTHK